MQTNRTPSRFIALDLSIQAIEVLRPVVAHTEDCAMRCRPRAIHSEPGDSPGEVRAWVEREE